MHQILPRAFRSDVCGPNPVHAVSPVLGWCTQRSEDLTHGNCTCQVLPAGRATTSHTTHCLYNHARAQARPSKTPTAALQRQPTAGLITHQPRVAAVATCTCLHAQAPTHPRDRQSVNELHEACHPVLQVCASIHACKDPRMLDTSTPTGPAPRRGHRLHPIHNSIIFHQQACSA